MEQVYTVRPVVCDWGVYEYDKLSVVVNSYINATLIADILNVDLEGEVFTKQLAKDLLKEEK